MKVQGFRLTFVAITTLAITLTGLSTTRLNAQSAASGQGFMESGQRVPLQFQGKAPVLSAEQQQAREGMLNNTHLPGPRLQVPPNSQMSAAAPAVPATAVRPGPRLPRADAAQQGAPQSAGTFTFFRATAQGPYSAVTGPYGPSEVDEPSVGSAGPVVFMTGNWFASYSTDNGATFNFVNPYTQFPSIDAGFCCDQTVLYDRVRDLMIWQLLYPYSSTTNKGSYRIAFASASAVSSGGWCYYDFNPASFGLGTSGLWLDYPNMALSDNFLWVSANVFDAGNTFQRAIIWRIPLGAVTTCGGITYNYFSATDHFTFTPTQGATATMYWASHNSTSSIRLYRWAESSGTISWNDVAITAWPDNARSCPGPDGLNWCGRSDSRILTGWVAGGVIGFMWNASQGVGGFGTFAYPYVHVARFNETTSALINQPILYNPSFAWTYPAVGVNDRGHIAGTVFYGGGTLYPNMATMIWDDVSTVPPPWETYQVAASDAGTVSRWGDYYASRPHGSNGNTWVATGQQKVGGSVKAWYVWFGRERDASSGCIAAGTLPDFNKDLNRDVPLRNYVGGNVGEWLLNGSSIAAAATVGFAGTDWHLLATGDFNGDGQSDFLWRHKSGAIGIWLMNGGSVASAASPGTIGTDWQIVGAADLDGDGNADIVLRHSSGAVGVWFMNGASIVSATTIATVTNDWRIVGLGDFNGDGKADFLWRNDSGAVGVWMMNGAAILAAANIATAGNDWRIVGTPDLNGDGKNDILWRHASGTIGAWFMDGATLLSAASIATVGTDWHVSGGGDINGDGKADILWRHNSGAVGTWLMNGAGILSAAGIASASYDWHIVGGEHDPGVQAQCGG